MARSRRLQTHLPVGPSTVTFQRAIDLGYLFWKRQPTLESYHFDDLKYDNGKIRIFVSRATLADYDFDRRAYEDNKFTVERRIAGRWVAYDYLGRRKF